MYMKLMSPRSVTIRKGATAVDITVGEGGEILIFDPRKNCTFELTNLLKSGILESTPHSKRQTLATSDKAVYICSQCNMKITLETQKLGEWYEIFFLDRCPICRSTKHFKFND